MCQWVRRKLQPCVRASDKTCPLNFVHSPQFSVARSKNGRSANKFGDISVSIHIFPSIFSDIELGIVYDLMPSFSTRNSPSYAQDSSPFFDVRVSRSFFTSYYTDVKDTFCLFRFTTLQRIFYRAFCHLCRLFHKKSIVTPWAYGRPFGHKGDRLGIRATVSLIYRLFHLKSIIILWAWGRPFGHKDDRLGIRANVYWAEWFCTILQSL